MPSEEWEYFCDKSYYDQWAVRDKHNKSFNAAIHVGTQAEAEFLCKRLNRLIALEAAEQERRDMHTELVEVLKSILPLVKQMRRDEHLFDYQNEAINKADEVLSKALKATKENEL